MKNAVDYIYSKGLYNEVKSLFNTFLPCAVIKGKVLSMLIYNDVQERISTDLDILCPRTDCKNIVYQLKKLGFSELNKDRYDVLLSKRFSHQYVPMVKINKISRMTVDLNFDIFWGEYEGKRVDIDEFLSDTIEMEIYGVKVKTLPPLKAMIQLILHHYKDMNSVFLLATRKSIKHDMFKDIYYLLKNNLDTITLDRLYTISLQYEIIPYVFYVLYYTGQVFDDAILKQYIESFRTPESEALLNCYGLCAKEQKEWKCDFKTRLDADNLYDLIKDDLTDKDKEKIAINKRVFLGVSE